MTSTTATKNPKLKVMTRMIFCLRGSRICVRMGLGRKRMARSVTMLTGDEDRYRVKMSMHLAPSGKG